MSQLSDKSRDLTRARLQQDTFLRAFARELARRGLQAPALALLTAGRPLTFVLGQVLWVAQPAASLFWSRSSLTGLAHLLEDEQSVAQLEQYLSREDRDE